jgi:hypothetical protein
MGQQQQFAQGYQNRMPMPTPTAMAAPGMPHARQMNAPQSPEGERYLNEIQAIFRGDKFGTAAEG